MYRPDAIEAIGATVAGAVSFPIGFYGQTEMLWSSIFVTGLANKKRLYDEMFIASATLDNWSWGCEEKLPDGDELKDR